MQPGETPLTRVPRACPARTFAAALAACLLALTGQTARATPASDEAIIAAELKANEDPTILKRRAWLDSEWSEFDDHGHDLVETLGALWSWRVSEAREWAIRVKLPVQWHEAGEPGGADRHGLGDLRLAAGGAWRFDERLRGGLGMELRTPSGIHDELSNNVWQLQQFGGVSFDAAPWLTLAPAYEYNRSVEEESGVAPKHFLELFFPAIFLLPQRWAVTARFEAKVDFEKQNEWTHTGKLVVARQLESLPLGLSLSLKKAFDSSDKAFQVNLVATYYL